MTEATKRNQGTGATLPGEVQRQAEEREAHIFGDGPRLQPIELNEVSSGLLKILELFETVNGVLQSNAEGDRGGSEQLRAQVLADPKAAASSPDVLAGLSRLPEIVLTMLHHADLFALHTDVGLQLLARGALSFRDRELAVLRIAWLCQAPYEWGEHVMVGKRFGLTSDDIARVIDGPDAQGLDDELARWRLQVIDERLADAQEIPTLSELAALCKLSVRQLARGFRASRGCSIGDYVANSRIERAKRLLASDQSIKTIGYALGFNSSSGFCFAIRRATGMTPGEFRASGAARAA